MSRRKGDFIVGVLGRLVFRVVNGVQVISPRVPKGTMKQTEETKIAAKVFGMASSLSGKLRGTLKESLFGIVEPVAKNNLNGIIAQILKNCRDAETGLFEFKAESFSSLKNYEFHSSSGVGKLLGKAPTVKLRDGKMTCSLPIFDIPQHLKFPLKSFRCSINVSVSLFRLAEGLYESNAKTQTIVVNKDMPRTERHIFEFDVPAGCLCVLSLCLQYEKAERKGWKVINNKNFNPGRICAAMISSGTYQGGDDITWVEMKKFS